MIINIACFLFTRSHLALISDRHDVMTSLRCSVMPSRRHRFDVTWTCIVIMKCCCGVVNGYAVRHDVI